MRDFLYQTETHNNSHKEKMRAIMLEKIPLAKFLYIEIVNYPPFSFKF